MGYTKKYPAYNNTRLGWIGDVPEGWEVIRLKFITNYVVSNIDKKTQEGEAAVRLFNYMDVYSNEYLNQDMDLMAATASYAQIANYTVSEHDVIITKDSEDWKDIAKPALVISSAEDIVCGYHLALIKPRKHRIEGNFLFRLLQSSSINQQFQINANGVTRYGLPKSAIGSAIVPLASLDEQRCIGTFLEHETARIDALIQKKVRMIELLKEKRTALITQAVTKGLDHKVKMKDSGIEWLGEVPEHWEVKRVKYLSKRIQTGCTPPTSNEQYYEDGNVPWFGPSSFSEDLYLTEPVKTLNETAVKDGVARVFNKGTVMLVGIGATIGKVAQIIDPASCNQQITGITFKESICNSDFVTYLLKTMEMTIRAIAPSATLAIFDQGKIGALSILKPPIHEQESIVTFLRNQEAHIVQMISKVHNSISLLHEYRSSLIHSAVTGKIDLRDHHE